MRGFKGVCALLVCVLVAAALPVAAQPLSGAIFTTLPDGSEVNFNIYPSKDLVYLDGGPGPGAPASAAGLPDGIYVFQVTDPSGKTLLSTDAAMCRQFTVSGGLITGVVDVGGCQHVTGLDIDHGATTVQLMPYDDTPNNGGEYKAWATPVAAYLAGCAALGVNNGLGVVDCGYHGGNFHGFIPADSKTDNFKTKGNNLEIDTRYYDDATGELMDGITQIWTDTLGGSNVKHSYFKPEIGVAHFAHIEAVEAGTHFVTVNDQPGCKVVKFFCYQGQSCNAEIWGPGTISVRVKKNDPDWTKYLYVYCDTTP